MNISDIVDLTDEPEKPLITDIDGYPNPYEWTLRNSGLAAQYIYKILYGYGFYDNGLTFLSESGLIIPLRSQFNIDQIHNLHMLLIEVAVQNRTINGFTPIIAAYLGYTAAGLGSPNPLTVNIACDPMRLMVHLAITRGLPLADNPVVWNKHMLTIHHITTRLRSMMQTAAFEDYRNEDINMQYTLNQYKPIDSRFASGLIPVNFHHYREFKKLAYHLKDNDPATLEQLKKAYTDTLRFSLKGLTEAFQYRTHPAPTIPRQQQYAPVTYAPASAAAVAPRRRRTTTTTTTTTSTTNRKRTTTTTTTTSKTRTKPSQTAIMVDDDDDDDVMEVGIANTSEPVPREDPIPLALSQAADGLVAMGAMSPSDDSDLLDLLSTPNELSETVEPTKIYLMAEITANEVFPPFTTYSAERRAEILIPLFVEQTAMEMHTKLIQEAHEALRLPPSAAGLSLPVPFMATLIEKIATNVYPEVWNNLTSGHEAYHGHTFPDPNTLQPLQKIHTLRHASDEGIYYMPRFLTSQIVDFNKNSDLYVADLQHRLFTATLSPQNPPSDSTAMSLSTHMQQHSKCLAYVLLSIIMKEYTAAEMQDGVKKATLDNYHNAIVPAYAMSNKAFVGTPDFNTTHNSGALFLARAVVAPIVDFVITDDQNKHLLTAPLIFCQNPHSEQVLTTQLMKQWETLYFTNELAGITSPTVLYTQSAADRTDATEMPVLYDGVAAFLIETGKMNPAPESIPRKPYRNITQKIKAHPVFVNNDNYPTYMLQPLGNSQLADGWSNTTVLGCCRQVQQLLESALTLNAEHSVVIGAKANDQVKTLFQQLKEFISQYVQPANVAQSVSELFGDMVSVAYELVQSTDATVRNLTNQTTPFWTFPLRRIEPPFDLLLLEEIPPPTYYVRQGMTLEDIERAIVTIPPESEALPHLRFLAGQVLPAEQTTTRKPALGVWMPVWRNSQVGGENTINLVLPNGNNAHTVITNFTPDYNVSYGYAWYFGHNDLTQPAVEEEWAILCDVLWMWLYKIVGEKDRILFA